MNLNLKSICPARLSIVRETGDGVTRAGYEVRQGGMSRDLRLAKCIITAMLLSLATAGVCGAQPGSPARTTSGAPARAPYLRRGDELDKRYQAHRKNLENFFQLLRGVIAKETPALLPRFEPPTPVPVGYQILPILLPDSSRGAVRSRIVLSPFSWSRTEKLLERDRGKLDTLRIRLAGVSRIDSVRKREYGALVDDYKKLVSGQKLIENQIQYNRFWQGEFALHPERYKNVNALQKAALERQALKDSIAVGNMKLKARLQPRVDSIGHMLEQEIRKYPTPGFVHVVHPEAHRWVLEVPVYTDITDAAFLETFRRAVESVWHVKDGRDDFSMKLDIRRVSASVLYPDGHVPQKGAHIDVEDHLKRFPPNGEVLTTGANTTHVLGRGIILGPHTIARSVLAHEFGHPLGFKDGYFRSYENRGAEGYEILEVILGPDDGVAAPEAGWVRREHYEQVLREKQR